jgi:tetratricopeptide (TPR) repeat protein
VALIRNTLDGTRRAPALAAAFVLCCAATAAAISSSSPRATRIASPQRRAAQRPAQRKADGGRVETLLAEGKAALERGDEAAARSAFERALAAEPDNVAAHTYLGVLDDRAGDLDSAEKHFSAAAIAAPFLPSARNNHGAVLLRLGRKQQAAAQFEVSLKLDPRQPSALVNLAQIHFDAGSAEDLRVALDLFERARTIAPDAEVARAVLVTALRLGDKGRAATAYRVYAEQLKVAASGTPPTAAARTELARALLEAGLADEAVEESSAAVALDPSNVEAVVTLGRAHLARKDIPAAGRALESAVARGLDRAPVYAALADVYEAGGYFENAIPAMRLAIARDPTNEEYYLRYGMLLVDTKAPGAAVIRLQEAVKEFPNSARLWLMLGVAQLTRREKSVEARGSFTRSLELDPKSVAALAYLGTTYSEQGQYAEAIKYYERAIAVGPGSTVPYYLAADAMLNLPELDVGRAEKYLRRSIELDASFTSAHMALARLHVRAERWTEAAAEFELVVKLSPDSAEARYQLARAYTRLKRTADAQRELAVFQRLKESQRQEKDDERRDLLRRLANVRF